MSSAELSLGISHVVSRALGGETIDTAAEGRSLAARFPDLGMSDELIGKAIARAAGMMGVVLDGGEEAAIVAPPSADAFAPALSEQPLEGPGAQQSEPEAVEIQHSKARPDPAGNGLSAPLGGDVAELVSGRHDDDIFLNAQPRLEPEDAAVEPLAEDAGVLLPPRAPEGPAQSFLTRSAVAAMRRAFSRA